MFLGHILVAQQKTEINRKQLVQRHTVKLTKADTLASLSVGNGSFAFTVDATGLQSFPEDYAKGVPLGTQSAWGWHSFPNTNNYKFEDALRSYHLNGRKVTYAVQNGSGPELAKKTADYFRQNEHRLQLGNIGLEIMKADGQLAALSDIKNIDQSLDMWSGGITSSFTVDGIPVKVQTYGHHQKDGIAVKINSPLLQKGRISIRIRLPYPTGGWSDMGDNWANNEAHLSKIIEQSSGNATLAHSLDTTTYYIHNQWKGEAKLKEKQAHYYTITPSTTGEFEFSCYFNQQKQDNATGFEATKISSENGWKKFWNSGGAIDFSGSTDKRAFELERRIILSQYLTRVQCADDFPPQETGLTYNSWYGKPHLEMHWWHGVHFALWGRPELLEKSVDWYFKVQDVAKGIAKRQGYEGIRWQKMTDNEGREVPSSIGSFLIWQQPHFIYFTELLYRAKNDKAVLEKYKDLVFGTADFMVSFARFDAQKQKYVLGKGLIPAQERFPAEETFNPTYELVYWHWALQVAQQWRERLGLTRDKNWDAVLKDLSPLPVQGTKYLFAESATDSYTNPEYKTDHPSVFGALGMMPKAPMLNSTTMKNTFDWIWNNWSWHDTWGWDFPMTAMTATRLGLPEKAIESLLMKIQTNTYLPNGHNYQEDRLTIYLPGNGGILTAIAMMVAGYDDSKAALPGIPKNGKWKVKWEGLAKMP